MNRSACRISAALVFALFLIGLAACSASTPTPTVTPVPTATPTPEPPILRLERTSFLAPGNAFSLDVPVGWGQVEAPGGVQFLGPEEVGATITAYFQRLPDGVDPKAFVSAFINNTITTTAGRDAGSYRLLRDDEDANGHRHLDIIGQIDIGAPLQQLRGEWWGEGGAVVGLSLATAPTLWKQIEPLWPVLRQSYRPGSVTTAAANEQDEPGLMQMHASGLFTVTLPMGWTLADQTETTLTLTDTTGLAQFSVAATEGERPPDSSDLQKAMRGLLGETPKQEGYQELSRADLSPNGQMVQFEALTEDGFYRTELRAFSAGNVTYVTSFSAPPSDWDLYAPVRQFLVGTLQLSSALPPDEATQQANPLAGIEVGRVMFYKAGGGALWVSAPIYNRRSRNLDDLTAAVQLFDADDNLLGAESWRMPQRILAAGGVAYLTLRLAGTTANMDKVSYVRIDPLNPHETEQPAPKSWVYESGEANVNDKSDVVLNLTMRNPSKETRHYIYVVALIYDSTGKLVFARGETKALPYPVGPNELVDLNVTVWGPFPDLATFDAVGEVPGL